MSMLISQVDELRALAGGLRKLYENSANLTRAQVAGLTTAVEVMREAADTIECLRERLQELQGVGGESRYTALFGTPERAAQTLKNGTPLCSWCDTQACNKNGGECSLFDYDTLLEWLSGDAE